MNKYKLKTVPLTNKFFNEIPRSIHALPGRSRAGVALRLRGPGPVAGALPRLRHVGNRRPGLGSVRALLSADTDATRRRDDTTRLTYKP